MKTINMVAECFQNAIEAINILIHAGKQAAHMVDDGLTAARDQQLADLQAALTIAATPAKA